MDDTDITTELTASVRQVLDVYDAALDVVATWLALEPAEREPGHGAAVVALARALAGAGLLTDGAATL